jgi:D-glycero-D-manno-heptose 1,7-bisphosphate phosphatase
LAGYVSRWLESSLEFAVLCHPNLHMEDSDILGLDERGIIRSYVEKGSGRAIDRGLLQVAATGAMFFTRRAFEFTSTSENDVTKALVKSSLGTVGGVGVVTSHYFKDSGTPDRLASIQKDFTTGVGPKRGAQSRSAVFLDRDGTLFADLGTARTDVATGEIDSRISKSIARCNSLGIPVFVFTNQPGIAKGEIAVGDVFGVHNRIAQELAHFGAIIDAMAFCPHHPEAGFESEIKELKIVCGCRKPKPGMLYKLAKDHGLNLETSVVIGDRSVDELAAEQAGSEFLLASFDGSVGRHTSEALDLACERIISVSS